MLGKNFVLVLKNKKRMRWMRRIKMSERREETMMAFGRIKLRCVHELNW